MRRLLSISLLCSAAWATSAACSARSVRTPGVDRGPRTGLVKYQISNVRSIDRERRRDAEARMYAACGGAFIIVSERRRNDRSVVYREGRRGRDVHVRPIAYRYIEYACASGAPAYDRP
jgi:hypothetical protein